MKNISCKHCAYQWPIYDSIKGRWKVVCGYYDMEYHEIELKIKQYCEHQIENGTKKGGATAR